MSLQPSNDPSFDDPDQANLDGSVGMVPAGTVRIDPTEEFDVGTTFECFEEAFDAAQAFAQAALLYQTKRQKNTYFYCFRSGTCKATVTPENRKRKKYSTKCDCKFQINMVQNENKGFVVTKIKSEHNHVLYEPEEVAELPRYRRSGEALQAERYAFLSGIFKNIASHAVRDDALFENAKHVLSSLESVTVKAAETSTSLRREAPNSTGQNTNTNHILLNGRGQTTTGGKRSRGIQVMTQQRAAKNRPMAEQQDTTTGPMVTTNASGPSIADV
jgi:hypothetical protein